MTATSTKTASTTARKNAPPPFRLALSLPCNASGAAYTAGTLDFLTHALHTWEHARRALNPDIPRWRVELCSLAGASFGGVVASLFAASLHFRHDALLSHFEQGVDMHTAPPNNSLYDAWVRRFGPALLLRARDHASSKIRGRRRDCASCLCDEEYMCACQDWDEGERLNFHQRWTRRELRALAPPQHAHLFSATFVHDLLDAAFPEGPTVPRPKWLGAPLTLSLTALNPLPPTLPPPHRIDPTFGTLLLPATASSEEAISYITDGTAGSPPPASSRRSVQRDTAWNDESENNCSMNTHFDYHYTQRYKTEEPDCARNETDFVRLHFPHGRRPFSGRDVDAIPPDSIPVTPTHHKWRPLLAAARVTMSYPVSPATGTNSMEGDRKNELIRDYWRESQELYTTVAQEHVPLDWDDEMTFASLALSHEPLRLTTETLIQELADGLAARGKTDTDCGTGAIVQIASERAERHEERTESDDEGNNELAPLRVLQSSFCRAGGILMDFKEEYRGRGSRNLSTQTMGERDGSRYGTADYLRTTQKTNREDMAAKLSDVRRFDLAPGGHGTDGRGGLACDALGAFGGLLGASVREHDFLLGRYECQRFLRDIFTMDAEEMRKRSAFRGFIGTDVSGEMPIIPLFGDAAVPLTRPTWPVLQKRERRRVVADVGRLVERRVTEALETTERSEKVFLGDFGPCRSRARRYSGAVVRKAVRWRILRACRRHIRSILKDATAVFA